MSVTVILLLPTIILTALVLYFYVKKNQYEKQIKNLTDILGVTKSELTNSSNSLKGYENNAQFTTLANLIISELNQGVICINRNRTIEIANSYAEQFIDGTTPIGKPYQEILHLQTPTGPIDFSLFEQAFGGKIQHIPNTYEIVCRRGTFPLSGSVVPISNGKDTISIAFIFRDNSEEVTRVKEEQAFFSIAAHELRTPLTIIRLSVSLLLTHFDTMTRQKIMEHLARTDETTARMVKLVNDFLNISRIDQGRLEIKKERFDVVTLTDEVIKEHMLLLKERKLFIHHDPPEYQRVVIGDGAKAKEVITNLLSNAIKYTVRGGITITHDVTNTSLATNVTDTGPGIPLSYQRLLFRRFGQIGEARQLAPTKSTGLGLYISKKFAQLMGGDVVLKKSEPAVGSTFTFTLPLGG